MANLDATRGGEIDFAGRLVGDPEVDLLELLIRRGLVYFVKADGAADANDQFRAVVVIQEDVARKDVGADEGRVFGGGKIGAGGKKSFAGNIIGRVCVGVIDIKPCPAGDVEVHLLGEGAGGIAGLDVDAVYDLHHLGEV